MMKKLCTYILVVIFVISCTTSQHNKSLWHQTSENAPANTFNQQNVITLKISNSATSLFLDIFSNSAKTIESIKTTGLSLWISKGKSPQKTHGIHYPLPYKDAENKIALEGFSQADLVAIPISEVNPLQLSCSLFPEEIHYSLQIPLAELGLENTDFFTVQLSSFAFGDREYLSSLTTAEAIERRMDEYKTNPDASYTRYELVPFFSVFELAKMPNRNP